MLEGPCCICGIETTFKVSSGDYMCLKHKMTYVQLLDSNYYTDPIAKLKSVYNRTVAVETHSLIIIDLITGRACQSDYNEVMRREYPEVSDFIQHLMEGLTREDGDPVVIVAYWIIFAGNIRDGAWVPSNTVALERIEL